MYNDVNNTEKKSDTNIPLLRWYKRRKNLFFLSYIWLFACARALVANFTLVFIWIYMFRLWYYLFVFSLQSFALWRTVGTHSAAENCERAEMQCNHAMPQCTKPHSLRCCHYYMNVIFFNNERNKYSGESEKVTNGNPPSEKFNSPINYPTKWPSLNKIKSTYSLVYFISFHPSHCTYCLFLL